jgi:protein-disulfide isomerase
VRFLYNGLVFIRALILSIFTCLLFVNIQKVDAQGIAYEEVVEKIRYNPISRHPDPETPKEIGKQDSTLTVHIWGDLGETYTKRFFENIFPQLFEEYKNEAQFVYHHRAFLSFEKSITLGSIGECAAAQGKFWENISAITNSDGSDLMVVKNVDQEKLAACVANPTIKAIIDQSEKDGTNYGYSGIPTFVIQNTGKPGGYSIKVNGAQDISIFRRAMLEAKGEDSSTQNIENLEKKVNNLEQDVKGVQTEQTGMRVQINNIMHFISQIMQRLRVFSLT